MNDYSNKWVVTVVSGVVVVLICTTLWLGFEVVAVKQDMSSMQNQVHMQTIQSPVAYGYPGASDSLVYEYACDPIGVDGEMAIYSVTARVKSYSRGDRVSFMGTWGDQSTLTEAITDNNISFTAEVKVPRDKSWILDMVIDHRETRYNERLQEVSDYRRLITERWGTPTLEGGTEYLEGSDSITLDHTVKLYLPDASLSEAGIGQAMVEIRVNGTVFKSFPMTWDSSVPDGAMSGTCGKVKVPVSDGEKLELLLRVQAEEGSWYSYPLEAFERSGDSINGLETSTVEWQAE